MLFASPTRRQSGSTLIISLIMLTLLTLFVLSAINSGTINLRIAANTQAQDEARAAAQRGIETFIGTYANFYPTPTGSTTTVSVNNDTANNTGDYSVTVQPPVCKRAASQTTPTVIACANGRRYGVFCVDTLWEVTATATRGATGVQQTVTQGVSISFSPESVPSTCK